MIMTAQKFGWSSASELMPDEYFSKLNIWHVAYSEQSNPLRVGISPTVLHSNTESAGLHEDEGGPLSVEPDEKAQLFIETIQSLIPDGALISCRVFDGVRGIFEQPVVHFEHIGADKQRLGQVFNRFGIDPDSIADYIFVSADPINHEAPMLQTTANTLDKFLASTFGQKHLAGPQRDTLARLTRIYDPLIWAMDGYLTVATHQQSKDEIKKKLAVAAAKYKLELPRYDFILHGW